MSGKINYTFESNQKELQMCIFHYFEKISVPFYKNLFVVDISVIWNFILF